MTGWEMVALHILKSRGTTKSEESKLIYVLPYYTLPGGKMKADKKKMERLVKTARGQLDGILRMMEEDRYCIDISNQLLATQAILSRVNREVLAAHMESCMKEAIEAGRSEETIEELMAVLDKAMK